MLTDTDILFLGRSEILMIKHGSTNVTKVPNLINCALKYGRLKGY